MTTSRWGATPEEWQFWAFAAGASADLLPAVADPSVATQRSPRLQHLESLAKTPSWIGSNGVCYGVAGWVAHQATPDMVRGWATNPAYNILLVTRTIRAIDIDIDDADKAKALEHFICTRLGVQLPVRSRANSGKRTLLLRTDPHVPIRKRVVKTSAGAIEFLSDGQQTALCGTHPSGARFELTRTERGVPVVSLRALEGLWDELRNAYDPTAKPLVVLEEQQAEFVVRNGGTLRNDPVLQWLENEGWVLGYEANGTANVRCPWGSEHTTGGSPNATSWLPAGLGGKEKGAFRCLHAHCEGRHTGVFLEKIGHTMAEVNKTFAPLAAGGQVSPLEQLRTEAGAPAQTVVSTQQPIIRIDPFTGLPVVMRAEPPPPIIRIDPFTGLPVVMRVEPVAVPPAPMSMPAPVPAPYKGASVVQHLNPVAHRIAAQEREMRIVAAMRELGANMVRDDKTGKPLKKQSNLEVCLSGNPAALEVRYDNFAGAAEVSRNGGAWEPVTDNIITELRVTIERSIDHTFERADISNMLDQVGAKKCYDSAIERLGQLRWDGHSRIAHFDRDILKMHTSEYSSAVTHYMWVAMAARVLHPGAKADIAPVLISPNQGTGKSSFVQAMALSPTWYGKINLADKDDNTTRRMLGKVVVEMPELRGLTGRDAASTKDFLSTATDGWVPKFKEKAIEVPRRCLFIGTDNKLRMLTDPTGNRRWAPLRVATTAPFIDWPKMALEIEQYWAEAVAIIQQFPTPEHAVEHFAASVRRLAGPAIMAATVLDPWSPAVSEFMFRQATGTRIPLAAIYRDVLGGNTLSLDRSKAYRIRDVMTALGYEEHEADVWIVPPPHL